MTNSRMLDFDGKRILVTGGNRGIGRAITDALRSDGGFVEAVSSSMYDLSHSEDLKELCSHIEREEFDLVVNNAGVIFSKSIEEYFTGDLDHANLMDVNLNAQIMIMGAAARSMIKRGKGGKIVNIASIAATAVRDGRVSYSASKAGLVAATKVAAADLGKHGILVNAVSPGFTKTEMTSKMLPKREEVSLTKQIPLGRMAKPEDIANAVMMLGGDLNTFITGQNLIVDGGYTWTVTP
jgi:3-oxoacyl-[acyl-carrier protein] reductase